LRREPSQLDLGGFAPKAFIMIAQDALQQSTAEE
jgi:hypothetical protein